MNRNKTVNNSQIQHYVPQFLLKNFTENGKHVYVYDKKDNKCFKTHTKNIASEKGFYNFTVKNLKFSAEMSFSDVEYKSSEIIKKIVNKENIYLINKIEKEILSYFTAIQMLRVKQLRTNLKEMENSLISHFKKITKMEYPNKIRSEDEIKAASIAMISKHALKYASAINNKLWFLLKTDEPYNFYISDNPITMMNIYDFGPYGNIGLVVKGIQIYFPISKHLALAFWCESYKKMIEESFMIYEKIKKINDIDLKNEQVYKLLETPHFKLFQDRYKSLKDGSPINHDEENVNGFNSLQIEYASRFIFSSKENLDFAKDVIRKNPLLKQPSSIKVY